MKNILLLLIFLYCSNAECAVYYVSIDGKDDLGTGTLDAPFRSIQFGINQLKQGDTLLIRAGRYEESIYISSLDSSINSATQTTRIKNYKNEKVIIDGTTALKTKWKLYLHFVLN